MNYKIIIQANMPCADNEIIGAKEAISEALELMGCDVDYINVMPGVIDSVKSPLMKKYGLEYTEEEE